MVYERLSAWHKVSVCRRALVLGGLIVLLLPPGNLLLKFSVTLAVDFLEIVVISLELFVLSFPIVAIVGQLCKFSRIGRILLLQNPDCLLQFSNFVRGCALVRLEVTDLQQQLALLVDDSEQLLLEVLDREMEFLSLVLMFLSQFLRTLLNKNFLLLLQLDKLHLQRLIVTQKFLFRSTG